MTKVAAPKSLLVTHINRLREKLSEWRNPADPVDDDQEFIDIWFVDGDVLSVYINSSPGDYRDAWPSLYSLGRREDAPPQGEIVDEVTKELTDSIAIAVSYFIFGRFRESLVTQGRRFLLTPEHERELDAMAIAVSYAWQSDGAAWMSSLMADYLALANVNEGTNSEKHIDNIFQLLRAGSPSSKVSRTLELRRRVGSMQDTAFFPSEKAGSAFAFSAMRAPHMARVKQLADEAIDIFVNTLNQTHRGAAQFEPIKRAVFAFHAPDRRMREYVDEILLKAREQPFSDEGKSGNPLIQFDKDLLTHQAKIAAREVSDVYSLARLVALAESLNNEHPQGNRLWRVNLLTGSNKQRVLRERWKEKSAAVKFVRLVHPLSVMGVDGFVQPDEGGKERNLSQETTGAYALRTLKDGSSNDIDVGRFIHDFKGLLSAAAISAAPNRERWMRNLRLKIEALSADDRQQYLKSIRDVISRDFVATFAQLNTIPVSRKGQLPSVSLPALALPIEEKDPSPAQIFVMDLHSKAALVTRALKAPRKSISSDKFIPVVVDLLKADPTGYSALLCSGLGYLAQGRGWISIAEAVANTAVAFAMTHANEEDEIKLYPEGNEALYFAAFVSRMQVDGSALKREQARIWFDRHKSYMELALKIVDDWTLTEIGMRRIEKEKRGHRLASSINLAQLVRIRYEAEIFAANTFAHLMDRLHVAQPTLLDISPLRTLEITKSLASRWLELSNLEVKSHYTADVSFIGTQLLASAIQSWLCALADGPTNKELEDCETWISELAASQAILDAAPGSNLVNVLIAIFNLRTSHSKIKVRKSRRVEIHLGEMQFAALDEQRCPLFGRLIEGSTLPVSAIFHHVPA